MSDESLCFAQHYHERTKYDPQTIDSKSKPLDWDAQPLSFKEYKFGATIDLKPYLDPKVEPSWWSRISRLLYASYGITARVRTLNGESIFLRSAPSAGGLYPAEIYLISRGTPELAAGLYNYQVRTHSLLRFWDSDVWRSLQEASFWHRSLDRTQLAIATTAVFYRSQWRYQDRAYRRINLDTGHLLGNIELASALNDYRPHLIGGFSDMAANKLLYLDPETEGTVAIVALADLREIEHHITHDKSALPSQTTTDYPKLEEGELLAYLHRVSQIDTEPKQQDRAASTPDESPEDDKYNFPFCTKVTTATPPIDWGENSIGLEKTLFERRSTREYTGGSISLTQLQLLLDFTYQPKHYVSRGLDNDPDYFDLDSIETFIAVTAVEGLDDGCYYYAPKAQELRQVRFKNFRRELHFLCLGQPLGRDAAVVLFHTADLARAVGKYGERAYRYLHLDAGHLGQRLNLAAIHLGLGASGIAGFFDDRVNEVLGIPEDEAVIYITTLGEPKLGR
ncbi:SagB/ThcOx family dehydrogenase [Oscillatoriales cyanobacterium LEGE 11467]|uniref:SagB/ThcOx family dehydrogenase n=1 Tax=Zarconia navalis LEGE 11467 TaxID=1828826 RepID=A0A928Z5P2_9CYAN|nr:SagB/ThcOx family dehydrogenase [Zarconia navalis]MBE9039517.1 SagB/ThcOx family dehydrogenase [Zarconia navalis LEGE 11467]